MSALAFLPVFPSTPYHRKYSSEIGIIISGPAIETLVIPVQSIHLGWQLVPLPIWAVKTTLASVLSLGRIDSRVKNKHCKVISFLVCVLAVLWRRIAEQTRALVYYAVKSHSSLVSFIHETAYIFLKNKNKTDSTLARVFNTRLRCLFSD